MVTFASSTTVKNSLIFLNDFALLQLNNPPSPAVIPSLFDIAYYLAAFEVIITIPKPFGSTALANEMELIQMVNSFNPNTRFYMRIDGSAISTPPVAGQPTPTQQISDEITNIINTYTDINTGTVQIDGIWVDSFNFPNVSANATYTDTYRDVQLQAQSSTQIRGLYFAFTCRAEAGKSTWYKCTNLPVVLNAVAINQPVNKPIFFNSRNLLVAPDLFGGAFDFPSSNLSYGWNTRSNFYYDVLTINTIVMNSYNLNMQVLLAVTSLDAVNYGNVQFFFPASGGTSPIAAGGIGQTVLDLAYWLNYQYIATAAYPDFYLNETTNLLSTIFPFDTTAASYYYNQRGTIKAASDTILVYALAPQNEFLYCPGDSTQVLTITSNNAFNYVVNP